MLYAFVDADRRGRPGSDLTLQQGCRGLFNSLVWAIRSAHPELRLNFQSADISWVILEFAETRVYFRDEVDSADAPRLQGLSENRNIDSTEYPRIKTLRFPAGRLTDQGIAALAIW
jgi:hypothetical protein